MTHPFTFGKVLTLGSAGLAATLALGLQVETSAEQPVRRPTAGSSSPSAASAVAPPSSHRRLLDRYCVTCHNERLKTAGLRLDQIDVSRPDVEPEVWEKVVRKLHTGIMPPANMPQPSEADRRALLTWLETELDAASAARPNPGRTETLRRLNRTEYQNAIRDLLALDIDAASLLPADESGHGFDNVTVSDLPPTLLDRYISAAQKISRLAIGRTSSSLQSDVIRVPPDLTQEDQMPGLPIGTRGGVAVPYTFAENGEYDIQVWLARSLEGNVSGLREPRPHEMMSADRPRAGRDLHDPEVPRCRRYAARSRFEDARRGVRRTARARRHLREGRIVAARIGTAAAAIALQRQASSADHTRHRPGLGDRTVCRERRREHPEPPPVVRVSAGCRRRREVREGDSHHADAARLPPADLEGGRRGADGVLSRGAGRRRFRGRNREGVERGPHQPRVPVPRGSRSEEDTGRRRLQNQRSRAGIPAVVLPVEQHPGR